VPGNPWEARAYGKCRRKYTAGVSAPVRVKWCGKSAPRGWQQPWQGKPHPEQDQIGEHWRGPRCSRVGRSRCTVTCIPDEWLSTTEPGLQAGFLISDVSTAISRYKLAGHAVNTSLYARRPRPCGRRSRKLIPANCRTSLIP